MDLRYLLAQLRRRAWVTALCLVATAAAAYLVQASIPARYQVQASLVLVPPSLAQDPGSNPFLSIGGLNPAADVLVRALNYSSFHEQVAPGGGTRTYDVARDTDASGPLLVVTASDVTAAGANDVLDTVVAQAPVSMKQLQVDIGVSNAAMIDVLEIARETEPTVDTKSQQRALLLVVGGGLGATLLGVGLLDRWLLSRTPRRRTPGRSAGTGSTPVPGAGPGPRPEPSRPKGTASAPADPRSKRRRVPPRPGGSSDETPVGGVAQLEELISQPSYGPVVPPADDSDATPFRGVKGTQ